MLALGAQLRRALVVVCFAAIVTTLFVAAPASAAVPDAPQGLTPDGVAVPSNPTLSWERVPEATSYRVELSTNPSFSPLISGAGTTKTENVHFTPPVALPAGLIYWRVAAVSSSGTGDYSSTAFTREAIGVPSLLAPAHGAELQAPTEPEAYSWEPVDGATGYQIQIDDDPEFANASTPVNVTRTSFTVSTLPGAGDKYWRVRAKLSSTLVGGWSEVRHLDVKLFDTGVSTTPQSPANDPNIGRDETVLDWRPVPGAVTYDVEIALDDGFLNKAHTASGVVGTRYSPPTELANDQYWWRVRPVDAAGHKGSWGVPWTFKRHWPSQPALQFPQDRATLSQDDRMFFQWSGVRLASSYQLQLATNPDFTSYESCTTANTTFTPNIDLSSSHRCMPVAGTTYYWRVIATDTGPSTTPSKVTSALSAQVRSFTYLPDVVSQLAPAPGASVSVPTLRWRARSGAAQYRVQVFTSTGAEKVDVTTTGTSFTPRTLLEPGSYRWQVQAITAGNRSTNPLLPIAQPTFTVLEKPAGTSTAPQPIGSPIAPSPRVPTMRWTAVADATKYTLRIKRSDNPTWSTVSSSIVYPAAEDTGKNFLAPGDYEWYVEAYNGSTLLAAGSPGRFTIAQPAMLSGYQAALVGTDLDTDDPTRSCEADAPKTCQNLRQTPVLAWDADPDAASYRLILSKDAERTTARRVIDVYGTEWIDTATLEDTNAESGTYWVVLSCHADGICPELPAGPSDHVFNKQSLPVALESFENGTDEVTLSWKDYLAEPASDDGGTPLTHTAPTVEARYYKVQTSTREDFSTGNIDNIVGVDQTQFTSPSKVYPDGRIYWRVRAVDGSGRDSAWSEVVHFDVRSPAPKPLAPLTGQTFSPGSVFAWEPLPMAASYEVRILKNDGTSIESPVYVSTTTGIQQTSYAHPKSLPVIAPAADGNNYRWFIRRRNASGGWGPWSDGIPFRVVAESPELLEPATDGVVEPRAAVFTWRRHSRAATYRFEDRATGGSSSSVTTVALSYAPTSARLLGKREWRVIALDADGNEVGASPWRPYTVEGIAGQVSISGQSRVGGTLVASSSWTPADVSVAYQWRRGTSNISGATGSSYTLTSSDLGKAITVRATATKAGYTSVSVISNGVSGTPGVAPTASKAPVISGTARIGYTLTTTNGSWSPAPTSYAYQWYRNGAAIKGATKKTYVVGTSDPGTNLRVRVYATRSGHSTGNSLSANRAIPKVASTTTARFVDATITRTTTPKMTVVVKAKGYTNPTGYVRIYEGSRLLKTAYLGSSSRGRVTVSLPRRAVGKHYLVAKFAGTARTKSSKSARVLLSVRR